MSNNKSFVKNQSGNAVVIVLVALVVIAVGALAYLSGKMAGEQQTETPASASQAVASDAIENQAASAPADPAQEAVAETAALQNAENAAAPLTIEPGNPVVAKVGDQEITRSDVINFVQGLPEETRNLPADQLFPLALEQVINARIVQSKTQNVDVEENEEFKRQLDLARQQIAQRLYVENLVNDRITEDRLNESYNQYKANFPDVEEVKAAHILVKDEALAKEILQKLNDGGDFAALAQENSIDRTSQNGGDLGYFLKTDVVPAFGDAAFSITPGTYGAEPAKSEFGFHIIKVEDRRKREPVDFETAKPFLEAQLRQQALDELLKEWQNDMKIERFDINGKPIEPAAGDETPAAGAQ